MNITRKKLHKDCSTAYSTIRQQTTNGQSSRPWTNQLTDGKFLKITVKLRYI